MAVLHKMEVNNLVIFLLELRVVFQLLLMDHRHDMLELQVYHTKTIYHTKVVPRKAKNRSMLGCHSWEVSDFRNAFAYKLKMEQISRNMQDFMSLPCLSERKSILEYISIYSHGKQKMDISSLCLPLVKITGRRLEDFRIAAGWIMSHDSNLTDCRCTCQQRSSTKMSRSTRKWRLIATVVSWLPLRLG